MTAFRPSRRRSRTPRPWTLTANVVLTRYAPIWEVLFPQVVNRLVAQLVWEVRWDGPKDSFTVVLDETAIVEEHAKLKLRDEEHANRTKPWRKRKKAKRGRPTPTLP